MGKGSSNQSQDASQSSGLFDSAIAAIGTGHLSDALAQTPPRESSGSRSANRFEYQCDWTLCELLRVHESGNDYVIVFDFHDDVLVLDSATDPKTVIFYQIKTKDTGTWNAAELIKRAAGAKAPLPSILGKLYENYKKFAQYTRGLRFVSNVPFDIAHVSGKNGTSYRAMRYSEIGDTDQKQIFQGLKQEHGIAADDAGIQLITLQLDSLSLHEHGTHVKGRIVEFLAKSCGNPTSNVNEFYATLREEIARGQTREHLPSSFAELIEFKTITRAKFDEMLKDLARSQRRADWHREIVDRLNAENAPFGEVRRIGEAARNYCIERLERASSTLADAAAVAEQAATTCENIDSLYATIQKIYSDSKAEFQEVVRIYGVPYALAMIGVAIFERTELPNPDSDVEDKAI